MPAQSPCSSSTTSILILVLSTGVILRLTVGRRQRIYSRSTRRYRGRLKGDGDRQGSSATESIGGTQSATVSDNDLLNNPQPQAMPLVLGCVVGIKN